MRDHTSQSTGPKCVSNILEYSILVHALADEVLNVWGWWGLGFELTIRGRVRLDSTFNWSSWSEAPYAEIL